ncbi:hypothetical protein FNI94_19890 [Salmonella enterica subsp. houtenae]|nr:hypothetical protein [Salmonella enterica subsp. houtenae]
MITVLITVYQKVKSCVRRKNNQKNGGHCSFYRFFRAGNKMIYAECKYFYTKQSFLICNYAMCKVFFTQYGLKSLLFVIWFKHPRGGSTIANKKRQDRHHAKRRAE